MSGTASEQLTHDFEDVGEVVAANIQRAVMQATENVLINRLKALDEQLNDGCTELVKIIDRLWQGEVTGSTAVRFMAVLSIVRKSIGLLDSVISNEVDTESSTRPPGRLQTLVSNYFEQTGRTSEHVEGRTIFRENKLWASALNVAAIKAYEPMAELVKESVNGQTLSSMVRELVKDARDEGGLDNVYDALPEEIRAAVKISEVSSIKTKKSA